MSIQSNIERGRSWMAGAAQKFRHLFSGLAGAGEWDALHELSGIRAG